MDKGSTTEAGATTLFAGEAWFDPIEAGLQERIRGLIEEPVEQELAAALGRGRYKRGPSLRRPSPRASRAAADRLLRDGGDRRTAGPAAGRGRHDAGVAQRRSPPLRAQDPPGRGAAFYLGAKAICSSLQRLRFMALVPLRMQSARKSRVQPGPLRAVRTKGVVRKEEAHLGW
jgi:hypothetical protein